METRVSETQKGSNNNNNKGKLPSQLQKWWKEFKHRVMQAAAIETGKDDKIAFSLNLQNVTQLCQYLEFYLMISCWMSTFHNSQLHLGGCLGHTLHPTVQKVYSQVCVQELLLVWLGNHVEFGNGTQVSLSQDKCLIFCAILWPLTIHFISLMFKQLFATAIGS